MTVVSAEAEGVSLNKSSLNSLSSKFLTQSNATAVNNYNAINNSNSNSSVINALKATQQNPEAARKREELQRRIEETRRKLQSVGAYLFCLCPPFSCPNEGPLTKVAARSTCQTWRINLITWLTLSILQNISNSFLPITFYPFFLSFSLLPCSHFTGLPSGRVAAAHRSVTNPI